MEMKLSLAIINIINIYNRKEIHFPSRNPQFSKPSYGIGRFVALILEPKNKIMTDVGPYP